MKMRIPAWAGFALLSATPNLVQAEQVYLSEIHYNPKGSAPEYLELTNASATVLDLAEWEFTDGIDYVFPEYSDADPEASFLKAWERIVISPLDEASFRASYPGMPADVRVFGPWDGNLSNAGERITLKDKNGIPLTTVDYRDGGRRWPVAADGLGHSLKIKSLLGSADDWRNWETSLGIGGTPGTEPQTGSGRPAEDPSIDVGERFPVAGYADTWRYHDLTEAPPGDWNSTSFDDGGWPAHPGMFGFDSTRPLPDPGLWVPPAGEVNWRRDSLGGLVTWYVRKNFEYNGPTSGARLVIEGFLDDGAIFYLNGQEIKRVRMPDGAVDHNTAVGRENFAPENTEPEMLVTEDVSGVLVQGSNLLAIEVHNESTGSSDIVLGVNVKLLRSAGDVVINEVTPGGAGAGFVEIYNGSGAEVDLGGYFLSDDDGNPTKTAIAVGTMVAPGGYATLGFTESGLMEGGEVFLTHSDGVTVLDGISLASLAAGESIGRKPSGGGEWFVFNGGSPGASNGGAADLVGMLELSEVHFDSAGNIDWVEAFAIESSVNSSGLFLATKKDLSDKVPLSGVVPGRGYASWDVSFPVGRNGEVALFLVSGGGVVIAAAEIDRNAGEETFQVFPASSGEWYGSAGHTRGAANAPDRQTDVVINEIMCDPPSDSRNGEFVELYNRGSQAVDLSGWEFVDGIGFEFPAGTSIPAGGYLVVAANADWIRSTYGNLTVVGNYSGNLSNGGELLRLEDRNGELVDEVDYKTGGDWPVLANGDGSSLELVHPDADNDLPTAWRDSDESGKSSFESFEFTGRYSDLGDERTGRNTDYKELHMHLVGDAHVILKNIRLERGGTNLLQNAAQDTTNGNGRTGWLTQGTHHASHHQGGEFHLISDGHGDNRANRAEIDCTAMNRNDTLTLKFDGRWVNGKPTMVAQTFDHSFAHVAHFTVPDNLGSPGAANSAALPSAPPVAGSLRHEPVVPSPSNNVVVTARVSLPPAGGTVELRYRADSSSGAGAWSTGAMNDNGVNGDAIAGDGVWTGRISDMRVDRRVVQFYVSAKSTGGAEVTLPANGESRPAMYIVDGRTPNTDLKTVRWVVSAYDRGAWANGQRSSPYNYKFPKLSNSYKNTTLIIDESVAIYNSEIRPSGSPWHTGQRANLNLRGKFRMPNDHRLHGISKYAFDNTPGAEGPGALYHNKLPRYWLYLMGHEHNESEFVTVIDGTTARDAVEIFEPIGNDFLERNFGDDGPQGELYRIDDIFRFSDSDINGTSKSQITDRFWWYAGDQWEGPGRYHTQWLLRSNEADYDYSTLINMLRTVRTDRRLNVSYTQKEIERLIDQRRSALMMAVRGYLGDWDNITLNRPKNSFFYRPPGDGKFFFFHHDSDLGFQGNHANDPLVATHGNNWEIRAWVRQPYNERVFRYYLSELREKYTLGSTRVETWFALEDAASREFRPNSYRSFFTTRNRGNQMVLEMRTNQNLPLTVNPVAATGSDTVTLTGRAGYRVWEVVVEGHPEAEFSWTSDTEWKIEGIVLTNGANALTLTGVDDDGKPVFGQGGDDDPLLASLEVTKTGDGTPIAELDSEPKSGRLSVSSTLELDARDSYDPEGEILSFAWSTPANGLASFSDEGDGRAAVTFEVPGIYDFGVSVSDGAGTAGAASREISVYGPGGFSTFGGSVLENFWTETNIETLDNSGVGSWYSLEAEDGRLTMMLSGDVALPLSSGASFNHPWISRELPSNSDWVLETELEVIGAQFVDYMTGLMVSVASGGNTTRYAWGYRDGDKVDLIRITASGSQTTLSTVAFSESDDVVLRIRRSGSNLLFDWRHDETAWTNAEQVAIGGATAEQGGIFASTPSAETVRVAFDYVMLIDPVQFSPFRGQVVVSEIMYNPDGGSAYEFLELHNTTGQPISLSGFRFPQGDPFDEFALGNATLPAGGYRVLVANLDSFTERYGAGAVANVIGVWPGGSLSNGGERVTLLDPNGLLVFTTEYSDSGDWPDAADDDGASLVLDAGATDPVSPASWSASMFAGGSPGVRDGESLADWQARTGAADLLADDDGNGMNALLTFALGLDLAAGGLGEALPTVGTADVGGKTYATLTFRRRIGSESEGLTYVVEVAQGLSGWSSAPGSTVELGRPDYVGDGTEEVTVRSSVALEDGLEAAQMRLRVSLN